MEAQMEVVRVSRAGLNCLVGFLCDDNY